MCIDRMTQKNKENLSLIQIWSSVTELINSTVHWLDKVGEQSREEDKQCSGTSYFIYILRLLYWVTILVGKLK